MSSIYTRRQMIRSGLAGLAGLSAFGLAACSGATPGTAVTATQGPVAMNLFFWGSATRDKLTKQAMSAFHTQNTNVTITSQYTAFNDFWGKLDAFVASGKTPDLFQMDMRYLAKYVRGRLMFDLTQLVYNQTIDLSDFDPLMLAGSKANNTLYGIPLGGNYQCMIYDTALVDKAGVGAPPQGMSWQGFGEYALSLTKALGNGIYGSGDSSGDVSVYEIWVRQRGKELYTADGRLGYDVQDVEDWFNYWSQLRNSGACVPANVQAAFANATGAANSTLIKGKSVFVIPHTNEFESYQALSQHKLALLPIPNGPGPGLYFKPSLLISISAKTPYIEEAANFINFIVNDPAGIKAIGVERGIPGTAKAQALLSPTFTAPQRETFLFTSAISQSGNTRLKEVLDPPGASQIATLLTKASTDIAAKKVSVMEGASTFYAAAQKALV